MTTRKPAFPTHHTQEHEPGMDLRDWFAGQALPSCVNTAVQIEASGGKLLKNGPAAAAEWAYEIADAMLKQRERK